MLFRKLFFGLFLALFLPGITAATADPAAYQPPALSDENAWTLVIIPDPQTYMAVSRNQGIFDLMCAWVTANAESLRLGPVLITGDLVYQNAITELRPEKNDQTGEEQWQAFSRIMETRFDGKIPYVLAAGNHDYGVMNAESRATRLPDYFPADRNPLWENTLIECGPNSFGVKTLENAAYDFTAPNGRKLLILTIPFAATDAEINWAKELAGRPEYRDHFGILLTHAYLTWEGKLFDNRTYLLIKDEGGNNGVDIWEKLVKVSPNLRLVVCGHIGKPDDWRRHTAFSVNLNDAGKEVYQMVFNAQAIGGGWYGSGGDGFLRLLEFSGDMKKVKAKTFSPLFAVSPATREFAWQRESFNEFEFTIKD